ncbi:CaiB/BaiF CoA transferase family protein [Micromonospora sp. NPDC048830]|uniref:CaiB/BaiF CoA transferase family protein n=1 Tax=Micromonospora sp. NPDC048830 TaxID=3364257 RepID=UPI0037210EF3
MVNQTRPLEGVRVIDMTRFVSGAYTGTLLAMLGADVIKIEVPTGGDPYRNQGTAFVDGESGLFTALNLGKRSVMLDLRSVDGLSALEALLSTADVFIENGRPGSLKRLGLDSASVTERYPRLVYGSISGYGQHGPDAGRGGFDLILQAEGGLMSVTGEPDSGPVKVGVPALDIGSAVSCALAIVAALYRRTSNDGTGAVVSSSLLEFAVSTFTSVAPAYFINGDVPGRIGSHSPTFAPYGAYRANDGYVVLAGAGSEDLWHRLCDAIDAPELIGDSRFVTNADRVAHLEHLIAELETRFTQNSRAYWMARLSEFGVPAAEVRDLGQVLSSPQVEALGQVQVDPANPNGQKIIGAPIQIDGPLPFPGPAPRLGEHTSQVLAELHVVRRAGR